MMQMPLMHTVLSPEPRAAAAIHVISVVHAVLICVICIICNICVL